MHFYLAHCKKVKLEKRGLGNPSDDDIISCLHVHIRETSGSFDSALRNVSMLYGKRKLDFKEVTRLERDRAALFLDKQSNDRLRGSFRSVSFPLCPGIPIVW